jgi:RNA polymerase sigma factor (sigma-70 family)
MRVAPRDGGNDGRVETSGWQVLATVTAQGARVPLSGDQPSGLLPFEDMYIEHHLALLRFATVVAGDVRVAEDAVAEVFARMLNKGSWTRADDVGRYLRRCVVNEVRGRWRREQRRSLLWGRLAPSQRQAGRGEATVDDFAPASDQRQRLLAAVAKLPLQQRMVVVLRLYEDQSEADTAKVLDVSVGTVKSSLARARVTLSRLLMEGERDVRD